MPALILLFAGLLALCLALFFRLRRSNRLLAEYRQRHEDQAGALREMNRFKKQLNELFSEEKAEPMPNAALLSQIAKLRRFYHKHRKAAQAGSAGDFAADGHTADAEWLLMLEATVREHMADSHFNIDHLARLMLSSRKGLYRRIRASTGMSVNEYIQDIRLLVAREKIETGEIDNLSALADSVGFRSANYFSRLFRERYGKSPVE